MRTKLFLMVGALVLTQACATAGVKVAQVPTPTATKFTRVSVPPFENGVGPELPGGAPEEVAGAVIAELQKEHGASLDVGATLKNQPDELVVMGRIDAYDPGSKAARFLIIGMGAGDLKLDVTFLEGQNQTVLERFSTDGAIVAGGVAGASMGMEDMIESASEKIVEHVNVFVPAAGPP